MCPCGPAIAHALELGPIPAFDLNAACSGGVLGLITALSFIAAGTAERVLLVASDTVTHHLAEDDAHTRILFGDGAAAFLVEACPEGIALRSWVMGSDGAGAKLFHVPHGGSAAPWQAPGNGDPRGATVSMQGRSLFRFASQRGTDMLLETCAKAGIKPDDLDWVLVHQANVRIVEQLQERTGIAPEKWIVNMAGIGNTRSVRMGGNRAPAGGEPRVERSETATADTALTLTGLAGKPLRGNPPRQNRCGTPGKVPQTISHRDGWRCRAHGWVKMGAIAQASELVQHGISPQHCYLQAPQCFQPFQPGAGLFLQCPV